MEPLAGNQTWWSMALDRQRSLAITSPLQELETSKSHIGAQRHDIRTYCLYVIDQVALGMRGQRGERLDVVESALADLVAKCEPQSSEEQRGRIVTWVIEGLLNVRGRGPFSRILTEFANDGSPRKVDYTFTLLEAKDFGDDAFYLVASSEAIRLYTDLLARDVTDEQVANEYLFRFLVDRGEWQKAAQESGRMELLSLEYEQKIRRAIEITERNVHAFNWKDSLLPVLQRARQHVGDRIRAENSVLVSLREKLSHEEGLSNVNRGELGQVERRLDGVICRHTHLSQILLLAHQQFAHSQDAQCYRPRLLTSLANLELDLVSGLFREQLGRLSAKADEFAIFIYRPEPRPLFSLVEVVDRLLRPEREHREEVSDNEEHFEELQADSDFLSEEEEVEAGDLIASIANPCTLSELLDEMAAQGRSLRVQDLVVTTLLKTIGDPDRAIRVTASEGRLNAVHYAGMELMLQPGKSETHNVDHSRAAAL
jgi:hypothetical protein